MRGNEKRIKGLIEARIQALRKKIDNNATERTAMFHAISELALLLSDMEDYKKKT